MKRLIQQCCLSLCRPADGPVAPYWGRFMYVPVSCKLHFTRATLAIGLAMSVFALWAGVVNAQSPDPGDTSGQVLAYDEDEAQRIDRMLMCPVCTVNIDQSAAQIAQQMRQLVRQMLSQGASRQEILDFFVERYGTVILTAPPKSGVNLVAWVVPVLGMLAALTVGLLVIRSMARQGAGAAVNEAAMDDDLAPYLDIIDQNLGFGESGLYGQPENRQPPDIVAGNESDSGTGGSESPCQDVN